MARELFVSVEPLPRLSSFITTKRKRLSTFAGRSASSVGAVYAMFASQLMIKSVFCSSRMLVRSRLMWSTTMSLKMLVICVLIVPAPRT
jgi:hypothetical protein